MIVKFDYGTNTGIDLRVVRYVLEEIIQENMCGLKASKCHMYLTFYDENGLATEVVRDVDNAAVDYIIREKPYKRMAEDCELVDTLTYGTGGKIAGVIYKKYTR